MDEHIESIAYAATQALTDLRPVGLELRRRYRRVFDVKGIPSHVALTDLLGTRTGPSCPPADAHRIFARLSASITARRRAGRRR